MVEAAIKECTTAFTAQLGFGTADLTGARRYVTVF
jgi:hypothetical protein